MNTLIIEKITINKPRTIHISENFECSFVRVCNENGIEKHYEFTNANQFTPLTFYRCADKIVNNKCMVGNKSRIIHANIESSIQFPILADNYNVAFVLENNDSIQLILAYEEKDKQNANTKNNETKINAKINRKKCDIVCSSSCNCQTDKRFRRTILVPRHSKTTTTVPVYDD